MRENKEEDRRGWKTRKTRKRMGDRVRGDESRGNWKDIYLHLRS